MANTHMHVYIHRHMYIYMCIVYAHFVTYRHGRPRLRISTVHIYRHGRPRLRIFMVHMGNGGDTYECVHPLATDVHIHTYLRHCPCVPWIFATAGVHVCVYIRWLWNKGEDTYECVYAFTYVYISIHCAYTHCHI